MKKMDRLPKKNAEEMLRILENLKSSINDAIKKVEKIKIKSIRKKIDK